MSNDELAAYILPWAKQWHPEKYAQTLQVATRPTAFRAYLLRLLELRWNDADHFSQLEIGKVIPISVLDETALEITVEHDEFGRITYKGQRCQGPITARIAELALSKEDWQQVRRAQRDLDLEYQR